MVPCAVLLSSRFTSCVPRPGLSASLAALYCTKAGKSNVLRVLLPTRAPRTPNNHGVVAPVVDCCDAPALNAVPPSPGSARHVLASPPAAHNTRHVLTLNNRRDLAVNNRRDLTVNNRRDLTVSKRRDLTVNNRCIPTVNNTASLHSNQQ